MYPAVGSTGSATLDQAAVRAYAEAREALVAGRAEVVRLEAQSRDSQRRAASLLRIREREFGAAVDRLNGALQTTYAELNGCGEARISASDDMAINDEEGLTLAVKPARVGWVDFLRLSGGQQALAGLALTLSFHVIYPSPVVFTDEIDAALDVDAVARVRRYFARLANSGSRQIVCVTLRPEM